MHWATAKAFTTSSNAAINKHFYGIIFYTHMGLKYVLCPKYRARTIEVLQNEEVGGQSEDRGEKDLILLSAAEEQVEEALFKKEGRKSCLAKSYKRGS